MTRWTPISWRRVHLVRSDAVYFDPNGPVSWDLAMTYTPSGWRAVNWKNVADNYSDGMHIPVAHPGLTRLFGPSPDASRK